MIWLDRPFSFGLTEHRTTGIDQYHLRLEGKVARLAQLVSEGCAITTSDTRRCLSIMLDDDETYKDTLFRVLRALWMQKDFASFNRCHVVWEMDKPDIATVMLAGVHPPPEMTLDLTLADCTAAILDELLGYGFTPEGAQAIINAAGVRLAVPATAWAVDHLIRGGTVARDILSVLSHGCHDSALNWDRMLGACKHTVGLPDNLIGSESGIRKFLAGVKAVLSNRRDMARARAARRASRSKQTATNNGMTQQSVISEEMTNGRGSYHAGREEDSAPALADHG